MSDTIKTITRIGGLWEHKNYKGSFFQNYQIELGTGNLCMISKKKTDKNPEALFDKQVGDKIIIQYTGEEISGIKKARDITGQQEWQNKKASGGGYKSDPTQIALSVCYKGVIDLVCADKISPSEIQSETLEHYEKIFKPFMK